MLLGLGDDSVADPGVQALQNALMALSQASFRYDINPGSNNGVLTDQTMNAVAASFDILSAQAELSMWQRLTIQGALLLGTTTQTARNAVSGSAVYLAAAAIAAAAKIQSLPGGGYFIPTESFFASPIGMGAILIGLVIGFKLLSSRGKSHADG